jgi:hypothetical protein
MSNMSDLKPLTIETFQSEDIKIDQKIHTIEYEGKEYRIRADTPIPAHEFNPLTDEEMEKILKEPLEN